MHIKQKSFSNYAKSEFSLLLAVIISYRFIPFHDEHLFFRSHSFWYQNCRVVTSTILSATWAFCVCLRLPPFSQGSAAFSRDVALCGIYRSNERKPLQKAPSPGLQVGRSYCLRLTALEVWWPMLSLPPSVSAGAWAVSADIPPNYSCMS